VSYIKVKEIKITAGFSETSADQPTIMCGHHSRLEIIQSTSVSQLVEIPVEIK
jgi:hypothetical protein